MNIRILIKILFLIMIFFIMPIILFSYVAKDILALNTNNSEMNYSIDGTIINYNPNGKIVEHNYSFPTKRVLLVRLDDVQGNRWNDMFINMTEDILKRNLSVTLAVIPLFPGHELRTDKKAVDFLRNESYNSHVEIALHGTTHAANEYVINESDTFKLATIGLNELQRVLKIKPVTFVPPANGYSGTETTKALSKLGFIFIGSGYDSYGFDNYMNYIGYTTYTSDINGVPADINYIRRVCNESLDERNICVVTLHPQDYLDKDGTLNNTKYNEFIPLLDTLKSLNATSITIKDLMK